MTRCAEGDLLLSTVIMLLENRLSFTPVVAPTAFDEVNFTHTPGDIHTHLGICIHLGTHIHLATHTHTPGDTHIC